MDGGPQLCSKNSDRGLKIVGPSEDQRQIILTGRLGMALQPALGAKIIIIIIIIIIHFILS